MSCSRVTAALGAGARLSPRLAPRSAARQPRRPLAPRAAFPGNLGSSGSDAFHGVFHSTRLPDVLADRVGLADARDAVEACSGVAEGAAKEACFAVFGVAPDAGAWIESVSALEASLELETLPEEEGLHHGLERC